MSARLSDYNGRVVIYGLHDGAGNIFYVGRSSNLAKRVSTYRRGDCYGNIGLKSKIDSHGVHWIVLCQNPRDPHAAEFDEIESRRGLVNLITDRKSPVMYARSDKLWSVPGVRCPTAQYMTAVSNRFQANCDWLKQEIKGMSDERRIAVECFFANFLMEKGVKGIKKWVLAMVERLA